MRILVYIDLLAGSATSLSKELIAGALKLAGPSGSVDLAVIGNDAGSVSNLGAGRVLQIQDPRLMHYNPAGHIASIDALIEHTSPDLVLLGYCTAGLDIGPYVAMKRNLPLVSYCTDIRIEGAEVEAESQIYGGKMKATSKISLPAVLVVNPGVYREADVSTAIAEIIHVDAPSGLDRMGIDFIRATEPDLNAIDITKSDRLLCVGRGIGDTDGVENARQAAGLLGAELVGSRPVVDAGWLPKERQVGKSGRKVKPRLYMALGVSGAPEHLEGMASSGTIVAVNSDARAPIFDYAHFGATVDVSDFLEALTEALGK
ncbi:electron transfer flavoprotein subunit alpha/FixB family protein [Rhizobium mongolense]|uniref:electron transfer flavoprotein subunit alpha/FixB family protein n=1 Tax=Rhizobium mongolense TaxID=57676 RepID=UPI0034A18BDF